MKKNAIYNINNDMYFGTLLKAMKEASENGYRFVLFNGIVYPIGHNSESTKI